MTRSTLFQRLTGALASTVLGGLALACGGSPTTATSSTTSATIASVATTYRGAVVESTPVTIPSPEALEVETRFTLQAPPESRVTMYVCVLESPSSIGVGNCMGVSATVAEFQQRGELARTGISTLKTDGVARTTNYVYVALAEGAFPWPLVGSLPRLGDTFGGRRVLATAQVARTVTFR